MHQRKKNTHTHIHSNNFEQSALYTLFSVSGVIFIFFLGHIRCWIWDGWIETFIPCGTRLGAANSTLLVNALWKTVNLLMPWIFVWGDKIPNWRGLHNTHTVNPAPIILYSIWYNMQCILYIVLLSNYLQYFAPSFGLNWCCFYQNEFIHLKKFIHFSLENNLCFHIYFVDWNKTSKYLRFGSFKILFQFCFLFFWPSLQCIFSFNLALCRFTLLFTQMSLQNAIPNAKMIFIFTCNSNIS